MWLCSQKLLWFSLVSFTFYSLFNRNLYGVDSNGLVQRAINASNVYENIAGYIEEANEVALLALNTTNRVKDVSNFHNTSFYFTMFQGLQTPKCKEKTTFVIWQYWISHCIVFSFIISWMKSHVVNYSSSLKSPGIWKDTRGASVPIP